MTAWWWLALAPVAYALIGYACAWRESVSVLAARERCERCKRPDDLAWSGHGHDIETGAVVMFWPFWVVAVGLGALEKVWDRIDPARIVEERAERARMHVLVPGEKEKDQ